jgi:SAM-dependent methyltransferase
MARPDKDSNRAFYDSEREDDRVRFDEHPSKVFQAELLVPWIASALPPGSVVLDIAGGSGVYASKIVRAAPVSVIGLDLSESMVRQRAADPLLQLNVVGDMEALPFASEAFDAVMFVGCLHHVPDPLISLREATRVLRPGGLLFAAEPVSLRAGGDAAEPVPGHPHEFRFSRRFLLARMRRAGLRIDDVTGKRLTIRLLSLAVRSPGVGLFRKGDAVDRALAAVGLGRFGEIALVRASRPGGAATTPGGARPAEPARLLACPHCHGPLGEGPAGLGCGGCGATYPVVGGLPVLLSAAPSSE